MTTNKLQVARDALELALRSIPCTDGNGNLIIEHEPVDGLHGGGIEYIDPMEVIQYLGASIHTALAIIDAPSTTQPEQEFPQFANSENLSLAQPVAASVDGPEFQALLENMGRTGSLVQEVAEIIDHINAWGARRYKVGRKAWYTLGTAIIEQWRTRAEAAEAERDELRAQLRYERENPAGYRLTDTWQAACGIARRKEQEALTQVAELRVELARPAVDLSGLVRYDAGITDHEYGSVGLVPKPVGRAVLLEDVHALLSAAGTVAEAGELCPIDLAHPVGEKRRVSIVSDEMIDGERVLCIAIKDAPAVEVAPVAWRVDGRRDGAVQTWFYWKPEWPDEHQKHGDKVTPLYTAPQPAATAQAPAIKPA